MAVSHRQVPSRIEGSHCWKGSEETGRDFLNVSNRYGDIEWVKSDAE